MANALREFKNTLDNLQFKVEDIAIIVIVCLFIWLTSLF